MKHKKTSNEIESYFHENHLLFFPALESRLNVTEYSRKIFLNAIQFWAYDENEVAGFMACYFNHPGKEFGFITSISVIRRYQGLGIGKKLLKEAIRYAEENNFKKLILKVFSINDKAIEMYTKAGFRVTGKNPENFNIMELEIMK